MSWKAVFKQGISSYQACELDDALKQFNQAIRLGPGQYVLYDSRAAVYEKLGRSKDALLDAKKVIDLAKDRWQGYARAARLFYQSQKYDAALTMSSLALELVKAEDAKRRDEIEVVRAKALLARDTHREKERLLAVSSKYNFADLPNEIFGLIFRLVVDDKSSQVFTLAQTCHHWRKVVLATPSLWDTLVITTKDPPRAVAGHMKRSNARIRTLILGDIPNVWLKPSLEQLKRLDWPCLRTLHLSTHWAPWLSQHIPLDALTGLTEFKLSVGASAAMGLLEELIQRVSSPLQHLIVEGPANTNQLQWGGQTSLSWQTLAAYLLTLRTLELRTIKLHFGTLVEFEPDHASLLEKLVLHVSSIESVAQLEDINPALTVVNFSNLTHMELGGSTHIVQFGRFLSLQVLSLSRCTPSADVVLHALLAHKSNELRELRLQSTLVTSRAIIAYLRIATKLEVFEINKTDKQANAVIEALAEPSAKLCPLLREVNVSSCPDIRTGAIVRLVKSRLPSTVEGEEEDTGYVPIGTLILDGCPQIEAETLPWLRSKVPKLSCVYTTAAELRRRR